MIDLPMKINILGASGSGVTTLGLALAEKLHIPYFDSDLYFWERSDPPFTIRRDAQQRNLLINNDMGKYSRWILGGSVINWGDDWMPAFDLVIFLWIPPQIRIARLKKRELERYGEVIYTNPERNIQFNEFIAWASGYDNGMARGRTLNAHETWMSKLTCPILNIREDISVEDRVDIVIKKIVNSGLYL
ncbi:adenylate kinase [Ohtaekwangia sp.]|uniref:adenylate kinase n=1 Tax=Ohtaekwangia sp. TaxID=2066019 RepID=UPI002F92F5ED